jgi:FkbM family methyltransferase
MASAPRRSSLRAIFPHELEQDLIREFFGGAAGFFVEVGANEPEFHSQTHHLEQLGWSGVLVEPQPSLAKMLEQRRRAKVYAVACSSRANAGKVMTLNLAGPLSSLNAAFPTVGTRRESTIEVPITTLDDLLDEAKAPTPIDFVSIDVEGHEVDVLDGFDIRRWRPRLVLVEDHALSLGLHASMTARGYKWIRRTALNGWYVPQEAPIHVSWFGKLQFVRKHVLGLPFRRLREQFRRLRPHHRRHPEG